MSTFIHNPVLEPRFQVWAENSVGEAIPVGPMACREFAERYMETINAMIATGRERRLHNPHIVQTSFSTEYVDPDIHRHPQH